MKQLNLEPLKNEFRNNIKEITIEKLIKHKNYLIKFEKIRKSVKLRKKFIKKMKSE